MTTEIDSTTELLTGPEQMTIRDVISTATDLRTLLVHHDRSLQQITLIDNSILRLTRQALGYLTHGRKGQALRVMTRQAVAVGVKHLYRLYRLRKWYQVQKTVTELIHTLQSEAPPAPTEPDYGNVSGSETEQLESYTHTMFVVYINHYRQD